MDPLKLALMIGVGAVAGTIAARVAKGDNFGFVINALLGIAGAIVGGYIFNFLGLTPGQGIVNMIDQTFGVELPKGIVGMVVSATVGAIVILMVSGFVLGRRKNA